MSAYLTRRELISVGERLMAERGINNVSLREIATAAHQANASAVQYYFGDREGLIQAIIDYRQVRIDQRRSAMHDALERDGRLQDPRGIMESLVLPLVEEISDPASHYVPFMAKLQTERPWVLQDTHHLLQGASRQVRLLDSLMRSLPLAIRVQRVVILAWLMTSVLAWHEETPSGRVDLPPAVSVASLIDMLIAIITSPVSATTTTLLKSAELPEVTTGLAERYEALVASPDPRPRKRRHSGSPR